MTTTTFDTLAYAKRLRDVGVPEQQAEVQASAMAEALAASRNELATKPDLENLRVETKAEFSVLRAEISTVKAELAMLKWMVGSCGLGILMLLFRAFFGTHP